MARFFWAFRPLRGNATFSYNRNDMKRNYNLLAVCCVLAGILLPASLLHAAPPSRIRFDYGAMIEYVAQLQMKYVEPAWIHGVNRAFAQDALAQSSFFAVRNTSQFLKTLPQISLDIPVPTTANNLIYSTFSYSDVFSKPETAFYLHESSPTVKLGQLYFGYDRHAALFNYLDSKALLKDPDILAFNQHQEKIQILSQRLQFHYRRNNPKEFATFLFPEDKIRQMSFEPPQPNASVFSLQEMTDFSQLPDISTQRLWAKQQLQSTYQNLGSMQQQGKIDLGRVPYAQYYLQKQRFDYLQDFVSLLQNSEKKRASLIMRYRQPIKGLNDVKGTDAEQLGYARFQADVNPTEENLAEYKRLYDSYGAYAVAEVLGRPYEEAIQQGANSIFLLSEEESTYLVGLSTERKLSELPVKIKDLESQLSQLRANPSQDLTFYKNYYTVAARLDIYRSLLKRTEFFQEYGNK